MISTLILDFGGVLAEEGFREGMKAIARQRNLHPDSFFSVAEALIHDCGYVTGRTTEHDYWERLRAATGIAGTDAALRSEILNRFVLRPGMLRAVGREKEAGRRTAILSDQTNWLDEIDARTGFGRLFEAVFNSYHLHKSNRDPSLFPDVCAMLGISPGEALFVDDNINNIRNASLSGMKTIHFTDMEAFLKALGDCPSPLQAD